MTSLGLPVLPPRSHPLWAGGDGVLPPPAPNPSPDDALARALPNDNRAPAGILRDGVLKLDLEARPARWEGEKSDLDPAATNPTVLE